MKQGDRDIERKPEEQSKREQKGVRGTMAGEVIVRFVCVCVKERERGRERKTEIKEGRD